MPKFKDVTGKRYGRLVVIELYGKQKSVNYWRCKCDCGNEKIASIKLLNNGCIKSCGCLQRESRGLKQKTHGLTHSRLFSIWTNIKTRTSNPNCSEAKNYIGKDIKMCDEWKDFIIFYNWAMSNGYSDNLSIDRIDNSKGYYPENCRWTTAKEQNRNKDNLHYIEYKGETHPIVVWAEKLNIKYGTLRSRINRGWEIERAFTKP